MSAEGVLGPAERRTHHVAVADRGAYARVYGSYAGGRALKADDLHQVRARRLAEAARMLHDDARMLGVECVRRGLTDYQIARVRDGVARAYADDFDAGMASARRHRR